MTRLGPKSIRGKITLLASVATAVAMVLIVAVMGYTMRLMLQNAIAESLDDRIVEALAEVEQGDYAAAVDSSGSEIIQVIDAQGNVVAESRNARGLKALDVVEGTTEVTELMFARDDADTADAEPEASVEGGSDESADVGAPSAEKAAVHDDDRDDDDNDDREGDDGDGDDDDRNDQDRDNRDTDDDRDDGGDEHDANDRDQDGERDADDDGGERDADDDRDDDNEGDNRGNRDIDDGDDGKDDDGDDDDGSNRNASRNVDRSDDNSRDDDDDDDAENDDESDDDSKKESGKTKTKAKAKAQQGPQRSTASKASLWGPAVAWAAEVEDSGASGQPDASGSSSVSGASSAPGTPGTPGTPSASDSANAASSVSETSGSAGATSASAISGDVVDARSVLGAEGPYIVQKRAALSPDGPMSIVGVASLASAARSAWQMMGLLSAIMAGVLVAVAVFAWLLTGRTLRPVEDMRAKAATITAQNLDERIDVPKSDKDLARLAETLNEMLARIGRALEEEKRFISDASHELKSPIAATSIILDSLRAHPEALNVTHAVEDLTSENSRMASIVSDMLALTRYDEGRLAYRPEPIDLMDLVMEESLSLQARSAVKLDLSGLQPVVCRADPELLAHAVRNVLDNASHYAEQVVKVSCGQGVQGSQEGQEDLEARAPEGGRGAESAPPAREAVFIRVSDDGCGIPPADRERVFGRFVCLNEGHTGSQGGTGLGLAVVASAIDAHGGTVTFTDPEIGGATVVIELPQ